MIHQNDELILVFEDEDDTDEDISEDEDLSEDEDINNILQPFTTIISIFETDPEVGLLNQNEKILLVNLLNNIPFVDIENYEEFKERLLLFRVQSDPCINYYLLRKITSPEKVNCLDVTSTLNQYVYEINEDSIIQNDQSSSEISKKYNHFYQKLYATENKISNSGLHLLNFSDEIIEKILLLCLPSYDLDLHRFFDIRLTCKRFYRIMSCKYFTRCIVDKLTLKSSFDNKFSNLNKVHFIIHRNIVYNFIFAVFKSYLLRMVGSHIIKAFGGFNEYFSLPFIENFNDKCLDNLCGCECGYKYHYLHAYINSPITRGIDSKGRMFLVFVYKTSENIYYEFIYNNEMPNLLNVTFSGAYNATFIGNKSMNYLNTHSASYRPLLYRSYDYMSRLIKGEKTGEVRFNGNLERAEEDLSKPVSLYFDKEKFIEYVNKNYKYSLYDIHSEKN
jgi:hypothetical protein